MSNMNEIPSWYYNHKKKNTRFFAALLGSFLFPLLAFSCQNIEKKITQKYVRTPIRIFLYYQMRKITGKYFAMHNTEEKVHS